MAAAGRFPADSDSNVDLRLLGGLVAGLLRRLERVEVELDDLHFELAVTDGVAELLSDELDFLLSRAKARHEPRHAVKRAGSTRRSPKQHRAPAGVPRLRAAAGDLPPTDATHGNLQFRAVPRR